MKVQFLKIAAILLIVQIAIQEISLFFVLDSGVPQNDTMSLAISFLTIVLVLINGIFLSIYFFVKKFKFSFFSYVLLQLLDLIRNLMLLYLVMNPMQFEMMNNFLIVTVIMVIAGMIFGLSLIFSRANKQRWLLVYGIAVLVLNIGYIVLYYLLTSNPFMMYSYLQFLQYLVLIGPLLPVFAVVNYFSEFQVKTLANEHILDAE
ncbi:hypothetical protein K6119_10035 [Paracrocinitomix mangrovi]|uniref:hypothetical protein n=1 Tax=Paracrocinitomix mangrovi TaxID=2862509 RepID=UPI001C8D42FD|nr:hypothetical protein [Paracrocinitomix mangrovi]UKN03830.1 hypothetical protein K6119_10035 [Paracrocinitomix mangrovi]